MRLYPPLEEHKASPDHYLIHDVELIHGKQGWHNRTGS